MKINKILTAQEWVEGWACQTAMYQNPLFGTDSDMMLSTLKWVVEVRILNATHRFCANTKSQCWESAAKWVSKRVRPAPRVYTNA